LAGASLPAERQPGPRYVVLDYLPEDDVHEPYDLRRPMTEAEWMAPYCGD